MDVIVVDAERLDGVFAALLLHQLIGADLFAVVRAAERSEPVIDIITGRGDRSGNLIETQQIIVVACYVIFCSNNVLVNAVVMFEKA